jgi:hypothetical protein
LPFAEAAQFLQGHSPVTAFERYAISGGLPLYLPRLAQGTMREAICGQSLDRNGPLWGEGRAILEQELWDPRVYFGTLEQLASGEKEISGIAKYGYSESLLEFAARDQRIELVNVPTELAVSSS